MILAKIVAEDVLADEISDFTYLVEGSPIVLPTNLSYFVLIGPELGSDSRLDLDGRDREQFLSCVLPLIESEFIFTESIQNTFVENFKVLSYGKNHVIFLDRFHRNKWQLTTPFYSPTTVTVKVSLVHPTLTVDVTIDEDDADEEHIRKYILKQMKNEDSENYPVLSEWKDKFDKVGPSVEIEIVE